MPPLRFSRPRTGGRVLDLPLRRVQISDQCVGAGPRPARGRPSVPPLRYRRTRPGGRVLDPPLRRVQISDQCVGAGPRPARGRPSVPPLRRIQRSNQDVGAGPRPAHPEFALGALARQSQAQRRNRTRPNFCKPRAQWPERKHKPPLRFCAPKNLCLTQGVTPVMGVRGKATMSTKCSAGAVPGGVLVTLPPRAK